MPNQPNYQEILESLRAPIAVLDRAGIILMTNTRWNALANDCGGCWVRNATVGVNCLDHCRHGGCGGVELAAGLRAVLHGRRESFAREYVWTCGTVTRWFLLSVTHLATGRSGAIVSCIDITEQKKGDAARAHLAAIVESTTEAVTTATLEGIVTSWNKGAEAMYGFAADDIIGQSLDRIVPPQRLSELRELCQRIRHGEKLPAFETVRRRRDGRLIPVALNLSPIVDRDGTIVGISGIARDVSERRKMESEILHAAEREQRRMAQELHDGVAQQIAGTACMASVLQQKLEEEQSPHSAAAAQITALLSDANEKTRSLAHGLYPVAPDAQGLMLALQALAERTTAMYKVACAFDCPRAVVVHPAEVANHLYRIAQEAVTNAVRHARPGHVGIQLSSKKSDLILCVWDDGTGIRRSRASLGGIGLRSMYYRAELIGGTLVVQTRQPRGTEVICTVHPKEKEISCDAT